MRILSMMAHRQQRPVGAALARQVLLAQEIACLPNRKSKRHLPNPEWAIRFVRRGLWETVLHRAPVIEHGV